MSELDDVKERIYTVPLGGKERQIRFNWRAWARLEEKYGSITDALKPLREKPMHALPELLVVGIVREPGEAITPEMVEEWFDAYGLPQLTAILNTVRAAIQNSMPDQKGETKDPPPAE